MRLFPHDLKQPLEGLECGRDLVTLESADRSLGGAGADRELLLREAVREPALTDELARVHAVNISDAVCDLRRTPEARALGERLTWAGFRRDMPAMCFVSDVVVLTSDNEGTPVAESSA